MKVEIGYGKLTYRDVRMILALLDGWPGGSIHFETGHLVVDAITSGPQAGSSAEIRSPAVGVFHAHASTNGTIGTVEAPLRSTPVPALENARIVARLVEDGAFVEYGQPLAVVMR